MFGRKFNYNPLTLSNMQICTVTSEACWNVRFILWQILVTEEIENYNQTCNGHLP